MSAETPNPGVRFGRFNNHLVCIDQSVWRAARVLLLSYRKHCLGSLGISFKDAVVAVLMLIRHKLSGGSRPSTALPVFGNIAIKVHKGLEIFDLDSLTVTKAFGTDVPRAEATVQTCACRQASNVSAAPRFIAADSEQLWYTEEFIPGIHGTETAISTSGGFMEYYADVEGCLLDLIDAGPLKTVDVVPHIEEITASQLFDEWDKTSKAQAAAHEVRHYQVQLERWLLANLAVDRLQLVLTHGDFALVNVIVAGNTFRVIDWEGIRYGNLYGDCFNFVFVEKYYDRARTDVSSEMTEMMQRYGQAVLKRFPDLRNSVEVPQEFAMRMYYLERLRLLLERDVSANLISVIRKSIRMFRNFDVAAGFPALDEE